MIFLFKHKWNRNAVRFSLISFALGTILMLIALMANNEIIVTIGMVFLLCYLPITLVFLFILFINTMANFKDIQEHIIAFTMILINIPIAILYLYFLN